MDLAEGESTSSERPDFECLPELPPACHALEPLKAMARATDSVAVSSAQILRAQVVGQGSSGTDPSDVATVAVAALRACAVARARGELQDGACPVDDVIDLLSASADVRVRSRIVAGELLALDEAVEPRRRLLHAVVARIASDNLTAECRFAAQRLLSAIFADVGGVASPAARGECNAGPPPTYAFGLAVGAGLLSGLRFDDTTTYAGPFYGTVGVAYHGPALRVSVTALDVGQWFTLGGDGTVRKPSGVDVLSPAIFLGFSGGPFFPADAGLTAGLNRASRDDANAYVALTVGFKYLLPFGKGARR